MQAGYLAQLLVFFKKMDPIEKIKPSLFLKFKLIQ